MSFEEIWTEYAPVVEVVAAEYGRRHHHQGADNEDFSQELAAWMWRKEKWLDQKRSDLDDDDAFEKFLARCLRNECEDYALDIRAQAGGQDRESAYWYSKGELEVLLPSVYDRDKWTSPPQTDGENRQQSNPAEGGNWITTLADVSRGLSELKRHDRFVLEKFYRDGWTDSAIAAALNLGRTTASMRRTRAIERLQRKLGGPKPSHMREPVEHDPWRGRHPVTAIASVDA